MNMKSSLWASALAAVGASLCCVAPLVLVSLGLSGAWLASLTQLEPYRPVFVMLSLVLLGMAGFRLYRQPVVCTPAQACADRAVQHRQRLVFWSVAVLLLLLLMFPWYVSIFD